MPLVVKAAGVHIGVAVHAAEQTTTSTTEPYDKQKQQISTQNEMRYDQLLQKYLSTLKRKLHQYIHSAENCHL